MVSLYQAINLLELKSHWTMDDLKGAFREKAKKYHPDAQAGLDNLEKSHEMMILLNNARYVLENFWKEKGSFHDLPRAVSQVALEKIDPQNLDYIDEQLKERYRFHRERAKKGIYVYYRFNLQRVAMRGSGNGKRWYREYRRYLDKAIKDLKILQNDLYALKQGDGSGQLEELYRIFMKGLIFFDAFQRAAECTDILPDYNYTIVEKQVFQVYRRGNELIDQALLELFMKKIEGERIVLSSVQQSLVDASRVFSDLIKKFPEITWKVEINIKAQLVLSALSYLYEFY